MTSNRDQRAQRWVLNMMDHAETAAALEGYSAEDAFEIGAEAKRLVEILRTALAQPAAGKPIGKVELFGINMTYVEWRERKMPPLGTELYAAPPAAAHGDEAEPSVDFAAWLINHREGQLVTEEDMHEWLGEWYEQRLAVRAKG